MKLWEKDTMVTLGLNFLFQKRLLQMEVVLLAAKASHATGVIFNGTNWGAFCQHPINIEPMFLHYLYARVSINLLTFLSCGST